jgi:hypothetical protein
MQLFYYDQDALIGTEVMASYRMNAWQYCMHSSCMQDKYYPACMHPWLPVREASDGRCMQISEVMDTWEWVRQINLDQRCC